jgi:transcriptional regulator with XRE-family HTH domain
MSKIGKNIRDIRKAHGETQSDLASAINVSETAAGNYETGARQPDMQTIQAIAEHYGFPVDRLLNEDFSQMDFKLSTLTWEKAMDVMAIQFPVICTDKAMQDPNFAEGYRRTQEIWSKVKEGQAGIMRSFIESAFQKYEDAIIDNNELVEAVANTLWLTFLVYALMPDDHSVKIGEAVLFGKSLKKDFVKSYVLKDANPISKENAENKRAYVADSQETVIALIRILKEYDDYADLADYYMALRYVIGMVANDYSDDLNKTIGMEMLLSFAELGNKYVIRYFKAVKSL